MNANLETTETLLNQCRYSLSVKSSEWTEGFYTVTATLDEKVPVVAVGESLNEALVNYLEMERLYLELDQKVNASRKILTVKAREGHDRFLEELQEKHERSKK